jgi:hypothetical protein
MMSYLMTTIHGFANSARVGRYGEEVVKAFLERCGRTVVPYTFADQLKGAADFRVDDLFDLEIKTEPKAEITGNLFYEQEVDGKPGWCEKLLTLPPRWIGHYLPGRGHLYLYDSACLITHIRPILSQFKQVTIRNPKYSAKGTPVPLTMYTFATIFDVSV